MSHSLESLQAMRADLRRQKHEAAERIAEKFHQLCTPEPADTPIQQWVQRVERAYLIYDGVMTGYKLMRRFHKALGFLHHKPHKARTKTSSK